MTVHTHLILGGARSGKSRYAEECAQCLLAARSDSELYYIATATADDAEMAARIHHHQAHRSARWQIIEEPIALANALANLTPNSVVLIDCLTLWLSNCLHHDCWDEQRVALIDALENSQSHIIMVSNEVGSGIVPMGELSRQFVDQCGWLHQTLAQMCVQVTLVVAGLPMALKGHTEST